MQKKILAVLIAVALFALAVLAVADNSAQVQAEPFTVSVPNKTFYAGEAVSVPVQVKNNPGLAACYVRISYDAEVLTLTEAASTDLFEDFLFVEEEGSVILSWEGTLTGDGEIARLSFQPLCEKASVTLAVSPYLNGFVNSEADEVDVLCVNGTLTLTGMPAVPLPAGAQWLNDEHSVYWSADEGVLTVGGRGDIPAFTAAEPAPWQDSQIQHIVVLNGINAIGDRAFAGCTQAADLLLPGTVGDLGKNLFDGCTALTAMTLEGEIPPRAEADTFAGCDALETVTVPAGLVGEYQSAPIWSTLQVSFTEAPVTFMGISLTLNGTLGLNFYLRLSSEASASGRMRFALSGKDGKQTEIAVADCAEDESGRYIFTCRITSIQMADTVTASFLCDACPAVTKTTSVSVYLQDLISYAGTDKTLVALAKAIADYGHYAQIALSAERGWVPGQDHAVIPNYGTPDTQVDLSAYAMTRTGSAAGITGTGRSVVLDSGTDLCLYVQCDGQQHPLPPTVKAEDAQGQSVAVETENIEASLYRVTVADIGAHRLGESFTVTVDQTLAVKLSVLSYAYTVLTSGDSSADECNAVAALYAYYTATLAYAAQHQ